ncbi:hypothetical protein [Oleisolibacter albus]|uniref:hypothetical protein n=1 Tax=Oleisolibacter albus TaxID=2171757 RepID=UPI000DF456FD|nr:hypothetical protein [Oleisolibacter albus]
MRHYGVIAEEDRRGLGAVLGLLTGIIGGTAMAVWTAPLSGPLLARQDPAALYAAADAFPPPPGLSRQA